MNLEMKLEEHRKFDREIVLCRHVCQQQQMSSKQLEELKQYSSSQNSSSKQSEVTHNFNGMGRNITGNS